MSKHGGKITIESSVPFGDELHLQIGFDGETFYITCNGVVIAKRGPDEERWRDWYCTQPSWSVVESKRPKRSGMGNLHFRYEPQGLAS